MQNAVTNEGLVQKVFGSNVLLPKALRRRYRLAYREDEGVRG
jgi:hypothetical protein